MTKMSGKRLPGAFCCWGLRGRGRHCGVQCYSGVGAEECWSLFVWFSCSLQLTILTSCRQPRLSYMTYLGVEMRWLRLRACAIWECHASCNTGQQPLKKDPGSHALSSLSSLPESSLAPTTCLKQVGHANRLSGISRNVSLALFCLQQHRPAEPI